MYARPSALRAGLRNVSSLNKQSSRGMKIIAILYKGGEAANQEPRLLGTVENEVRFFSSALGSHVLIHSSSSASDPGWNLKAMNTLSVTTRKVTRASCTRTLSMYVLALRSLDILTERTIV